MRGGGLCCLALVLALAGSAAADNGGWEQIHVRTIQIEYRTHDGYRRAAYVLLPDWYGPDRHPRLPLIISLRRYYPPPSPISVNGAQKIGCA